MLRDFTGFFSLVECRLETGRTHQIRVHMQAIGHALVGDPVYGAQATASQAMVKRADLSEAAGQTVLGFSRQALHAKEIRFIHPVSGKEMRFEADYPADFAALYGAFK